MCDPNFVVAFVIVQEKHLRNRLFTSPLTVNRSYVFKHENIVARLQFSLEPAFF